MISSFKEVKRLSYLLILPFLLFSCEPLKNIVKDFHIKKLINSQSDVVLVTSVQVDLEELLGINLILPSGLRKDLNVRKLGKVGSIYLDRDNRVSLSMNLSTLVNNIELHDSNLKLPNGNDLPMIGDDQSFAIPVTIGRDKTSELVLYVSLIKGKVVLGMTIGLNLELETSFQVIPKFEIKGLPVQAGAYVGDSPGETGVALFFDITDVIGYKIVSSSNQDVRFELFDKGETTLYHKKVTKKDQRRAKRAFRKLRRKGLKKIEVN